MPCEGLLLYFQQKGEKEEDLQFNEQNVFYYKACYEELDKSLLPISRLVKEGSDVYFRNELAIVERYGSNILKAKLSTSLHKIFLHQPVMTNKYDASALSIK